MAESLGKEQSDQKGLKLAGESHKKYLLNLEKSKTLHSIGSYMTEHLRMGGGYWTITSLICMGVEIEETQKETLIKWIVECQNADGGFGGNTQHDSHITPTHYAVLLLLQLDALSKVNIEKVVEYISKLQNPDGSFSGDVYGEVDTRFSYCAVSCLTVLNRRDVIDMEKSAQYVLRCLNFDGSFGAIPNAESHAAYVFCAIGTLAITGHLSKVNKETLGKWLGDRQTTAGGFNGRPEKLADVCYSWWVYSSVKMLRTEAYIDQEALESYILECQDAVDGGISDRPGNCVDPFHTFFGLAALSLLDSNRKKYNLQAIDPKFAIPVEKLKQIEHLSGFL